MSHDDSSGRAGSPLITQPSTGWVGRAVEQTESVLRVIPALLCNAPDELVEEEPNLFVVAHFSPWQRCTPES